MMSRIRKPCGFPPPPSLENYMTQQPLRGLHSFGGQAA